MPFKVIVAPEAIEAIQRAYDWRRNYSIEKADEWLDGLQDAIDSLDEFPLRCQLAPESEFLAFELRQMLYGSSRKPHRVLFRVIGKAVHVLTVRHPAQDWLKPEDF